jgi:hypothetical protein
MRRFLFTAPVLALGLAFSVVAAEVDTLAPGTEVEVRTNERIDVRKRDRGRIYRGELARDVRATNGDLAFSRGTPVELTIRQIGDHEMVIDLESILANGRRFVVDATGPEYKADRPGVGGNTRTAKYVGGGAIIGSIIGAIAGGGKGAAIGAAAGAATGAGAQVATRGREVHVPVESLLTFRLERPLHYVEGPDRGAMRNGHHYHEYPDNPDDRRQ